MFQPHYHPVSRLFLTSHIVSMRRHEPLGVRYGRELRRPAVPEAGRRRRQVRRPARRHPTRPLGRHAAVRALPHLPEGVQAEEHAAAARLHTHREPALPLPRVR